jgi:hypothetical protein
MPGEPEQLADPDLRMPLVDRAHQPVAEEPRRPGLQVRRLLGKDQQVQLRAIDLLGVVSGDRADGQAQIRRFGL